MKQKRLEVPLTYEQRRRRARRGAWMCRAIALAMLVGSWFVIEHVSPSYREGIASLGWTRTDGVILNAGRGWNRVLTDDGESYETWLSLWYAYEVPTASGGARPLEGGCYDVSTPRRGDKHASAMTTIGMARECLADAPSIPVHFDPSDPRRSVVSPGVPYHVGGWTILLTTLLCGSVWLLRAARAAGKYDAPHVPDEPDVDDMDGHEPSPEGRPPDAPPGAHYVKDEYGEYWRDDQLAADGNPPDELVDDDGEPLEEVVSVEAPAPASKREANVLGAVLVCTFVPIGGFTLMASLAYLWEKAVGGVAPIEVVLAYCAFCLLCVVSPKLANTKLGGTGIAACVLGVPLLGAVGLAFLMYEDFTDTDVRWISYEPEEAWLIDQMRSGHPTVREVAVRAAGRSQEFEAVKPLIAELCHDPHPGVAKAARHAAYRRRVHWR